MTPNEIALNFKKNLQTTEYEQWYERTFLAYRDLMAKNSFVVQRFSEDLLQEFAASLPEIARKWNPDKATFSTYLSIWCKGSLKQEFIAKTYFPFKYTRVPAVRKKYPIELMPVEYLKKGKESDPTNYIMLRDWIESLPPAEWDRINKRQYFKPSFIKEMQEKFL